MGEAAEKIIVYDSYDTVVQANLVKTKLDAYGIPCFLSEENFTTWYPFRNQLFPGVRLHIFERDHQQVKEILKDSPLDVEKITCPQCQSNNLFIEEDESRNILSLLLFITPRKKNYHCEHCDHEWC